VVIEPQPVQPAEAAEFLRRCLAERSNPAWADVLKSLRAIPRPPLGPASALGETIATPLGLWLLRTVYIGTSANPEELLDPTRFPDAKALRAHLFGQVVGALIKTRTPSKDPADLFRPRRLHNPKDVARWLGYLALRLTSHQDDSPSTNLVWWDLHKAVPLDKIRLAVGIGAGLAFGLAAGSRSPLAIKLTLMLLGGLVSGLLFRHGEEFGAEPAYADLRLHGRGQLNASGFRGKVTRGLSLCWSRWVILGGQRRVVPVPGGTGEAPARRGSAYVTLHHRSLSCLHTLSRRVLPAALRMPGRFRAAGR
jgi:hypothetical protein